MKTRGHKLRRLESFYNRKEIRKNAIYKVVDHHRFNTITHRVNTDVKNRIVKNKVEKSDFFPFS